MALTPLKALTFTGGSLFVSLCYSLSISARYVPPLELQGCGGAAYNYFGDSVWLCLVGTYPGPLTQVEHLG